MTIHSRFNPPPRTRFANVDEATGEIQQSLTRQSEADSCDINKIMAHYERTGQLLHERGPGVYIDCPATTYEQSLNTIRQAQELFDQLPIKLREAFGNDPRRYLDAYDKKDPQLLDLAVKLGVIPNKQPDAIKLLSTIAANTKQEPPKAGAGTST